MKHAVLPAKWDEDDNVFDFEAAKVQLVKRKDYKTQDAFQDAVSEIGDVLYAHFPKAVEKLTKNVPLTPAITLASLMMADLSSLDLKSLQGKDLKSFLKKEGSMDVTAGSVLLLETRKKQFVLIRVEKAERERLTFSWIPGAEGKAVFPVIPFERLLTPQEIVFAKAQKALERRRARIESILRWVEATDQIREKNKDLSLKEIAFEGDGNLLTMAKYGSDLSPRSLLYLDSQFISLFWSLKTLHAAEAVHAAVDHLDAAWLRADQTKEEGAVDLLKQIGRPASIVLAERVRDKSLEAQKRRRYQDVLEDIEGAAFDAVFLERAALPPKPKIEFRRTGLKYQFLRVPESDWEKGKFSVLSLATGKCTPVEVLGFKKWQSLKKQEKTSPEEQEAAYARYLAESAAGKGDLAFSPQGYLICSGRYANLGKGPIEDWADRDLKERVKPNPPLFMPEDMCQNNSLVFEDTLVVETAEKKFGLVQILGQAASEKGDYDCWNLVLFHQGDGTARFPMELLPAPAEVLAKDPAPTDAEITCYLDLLNVRSAREGPAHVQAVDLLKVVLQYKPGPWAIKMDRQKVRETEAMKAILADNPAGPEQKAAALELLAEFRDPLDLDVFMQNVRTPLPLKDGVHPAVRGLMKIQATARPALLEAIGKAKDEKERKLWIDALTVVEGKLAAEKLLEGIGKK